MQITSHKITGSFVKTEFSLKFFELIGSNNSLILIFFQRTRTHGFLKIQITAQHW